ncbi:hypothetical protein L9F63_014108, partial [Diploptera punctata]
TEGELVTIRILIISASFSTNHKIQNSIRLHISIKILHQRLKIPTCQLLNSAAQRRE